MVLPFHVNFSARDNFFDSKCSLLAQIEIGPSTSLQLGSVRTGGKAQWRETRSTSQMLHANPLHTPRWLSLPDRSLLPEEQRHAWFGCNAYALPVHPPHVIGRHTVPLHLEVGRTRRFARVQVASRSGLVPAAETHRDALHRPHAVHSDSRTR